MTVERVDLQPDGRTANIDRPLSYEAMAADVLFKLVADLRPSLMSLVQYAGADASSDSLLGAIRKHLQVNDLGSAIN